MIANYSPFRENALRFLAKIIEAKYQNQSDEPSTSDLTSVYDTFWPGKRNIRNFLLRAGCEGITTKVPENEYTYWSLVQIQAETSPDGRNKIFKVIEQLCDPEEYYGNPEIRNNVIEQVNKVLHQYRFSISETGEVIRWVVPPQFTASQRSSDGSTQNQDHLGAETSKEEHKQGSPIQVEKFQKSTSHQDLKNHIRNWVKSNQKINSSLGEIAIGKQLGEGGNALVFESPFANGTAIKFLAESVSSPPSTRYARFLGEYLNLIKLVPTAAIVPLYHFSIQDMDGEQIPFIVMESCLSTLHDAYKSSKLVSASEFQHLLDRLLEILEIIHTAGVVHRDIKPQNILLKRNKTWVLGDFGIAWFDPELHTKLALSEKNERLANFEFSAPEQIKRQAYDKATPSMDLYALGQTLYFCVTGHTIRGSGYPRFSHSAPELSRYEALIDRLVRQAPQERFQFVKDVHQFLVQEEGTSHYSKQFVKEEQLRQKFQRHLDIFDLAVRSAMPGSYGYFRVKKDEINRVMSSLASRCEECGLWWFRDLANNPVRALEKLSEDIWLIDYHECKIVDLWIYRNTVTITRQYVIVELAPISPFGFYDPNNTDRAYEEAAFFNGKYVTRAEFDDGYAVIDGEVIKLDDTAKPRFRNLHTDFLVLASDAGVFNNTVNDHQVRNVFTALRSSGSVDPILLEPLETMEQPEWKRT